MQYMGGKARIAGKLAPEILGVIRKVQAKTYWEPFLGGANMFTRIAPYVDVAIGSDVMPDLIMMWQAVQRGWMPPEFVTREQYATLRRAEPSALRAFVGFGCSFGGKWFGGYATQKDRGRGTTEVQGASYRAILAQAPVMQCAYIALLDYREACPRPGWVIYCDPPYAGTTTYGGLGDPWDAGAFWTTAQRWAESGCHVLVSEYAAPRGWSVIWETETRGSLSRASNEAQVVERLFTYT